MGAATKKNIQNMYNRHGQFLFKKPFFFCLFNNHTNKINRTINKHNIYT